MQSKRSAVSTDRTEMSPSTSTGLARTVLNIAQIGNGHRVACLGEMGSDFQTAMADTQARFYRVPALAPYGGPATPGASSSSRADVLLWATLLDERGFPDASLRDIRKHIRFGGRLVMWAAMPHPRNGRGDLERIAGLLHSASFDSIVTRIETTNGVRWMVATGVVHPILTLSVPTYGKWCKKTVLPQGGPAHPPAQHGTGDLFQFPRQRPITAGVRVFSADRSRDDDDA